MSQRQPRNDESGALALLDARLLTAVMLVASVACTWPILSAETLPCMDLPGHVALAEALRHLDEPGPIAETWRWGVFPAPNSLFYLLYSALRGAFEIRTCEKLIAAFYLVATPWALLVYARTFGRSGWIAPLGFVTVFNWTFLQGFLDYCLAIPALLIGFSLVRRALDRPTRTRRAGVLLWGAVMFFVHLLGAAIWCGGALLLVTLRVLDARRAGDALPWHRVAIDALVPLAAVIALVVTWRLGTPAFPASTEVIWEPLLIKLRWLPALTLFALDGHGDTVVAIAFFAAALTLGVLLRRHGASRGPTPSVERFVGLWALLLAGFYLVTPWGIGPVGVYYQRAMSLLVVVGLAAIAPAQRTLATRRQLGLVAGLVVLCLATTTAVRWHAMARFDEGVDGIWAVLDAAPQHSRLAYYYEANENFGLIGWRPRHLDKYHTALNQGVNSFSFAARPGRIIVERDPGFVFERLAAPIDGQLRLLTDYDVLFQLGPTPLEQTHPDHFESIARRGHWSLYRIRH